MLLLEPEDIHPQRSISTPCLKFGDREGTYFQFRFEAFNLLNHVAFGAPNVQVTSSSFGTITTQANRPRQIQIGFRFVF